MEGQPLVGSQHGKPAPTHGFWEKSEGRGDRDLAPWITSKERVGLPAGIRVASRNPSSFQSLSCVQLFATPACQASMSITNTRSLLKLMSITSLMPSDHLILCHPLLLPPSIFPSIMVFSNELVFLIRWPKYWSFSFSSGFVKAVR